VKTQKQMLKEMLGDDSNMQIVTDPIPGTFEEWNEFLSSIPGTYLVHYLVDTIEAIRQTLGVATDIPTIYQAQGGLTVMQFLQEMLTEASAQVEETDHDT